MTNPRIIRLTASDVEVAARRPARTPPMTAAAASLKHTHLTNREPYQLSAPSSFSRNSFTSTPPP